jgi:catechol 2,3-dioxygenase-like lactoylglutathione lyase family enzyme
MLRSKRREEGIDMNVDVIGNVPATIGARHERTDNKFGLQRLDHFAVPSVEIERTYRFIVEVLGGEPYFAVGFDEGDPRIKHAFLRVGEVLFQIGVPQNGELTCGKDDVNTWPHWAFEVSAADFEANVERVRALGIPVFAPVKHGGIDGTYAYFKGPEGHKLEFVTWEDFPEEKVLGEVGPEIGPIPWSEMDHDWPNISAGT